MYKLGLVNMVHQYIFLFTNDLTQNVREKQTTFANSIAKQGKTKKKMVIPIHTLIQGPFGGLPILLMDEILHHLRNPGMI